ncbi:MULTISPECIES: heat-inducible transcriptional repressor HrcA [Enterococcus]|uniref:Heat-inducible transcription repressor HrcA n=1 Tax=Enterococcus alishanensis TaxID=1303817 RepID=A0ABS6TAR7_9ENTE|nr:heat-inducible transcriptional repressor HrcA [Enterococcus alishanensis]MBV7389979.1 heat-inducible transcriptional repressor HrcA [Enterococcus alishanensis]
MLTERQNLILRLIIQDFTETGQPVGSKRLMEEGVQASSATIRNDMKVLEENGLIEKTHSSSGRVPSKKGYRYYIDHLLTPAKVNKQEVEQIRSSLKKDIHEIDDIISQSAKILSEVTSYTAFSLGPEMKDRTLTGFRIVPLNDRQILAIIVTDKGNVESQVFRIPENVASSDLEKMVKIINDRLVGQPLLTVYQKLRTEIPMILHRYFQTTDGIGRLFDIILNEAFEEKVFVSGRMNILNANPDDLSQFKSMYSLMQDSDELTKLLLPTDQEIHVRMGAELGDRMFDNLTMVQANYQIIGHGRGTIALLGPTSMPYSKIFGLLDVFRYELTAILDDYYRSLDLNH